MKFRGGAKSYKFECGFLCRNSTTIKPQYHCFILIIVFIKVNLGTTVTNRFRHTVVMCSFQCLDHQPVFQKKQLYLLRLASLLWYLIVDLNLVGLCDRNVGLITE